MILAVFCLVAASAWPASARPTVIDVRLGVHPDKTRFVMEVTDAIDFRVFTLPDPYRVVVDFPEMTWNDSANQTSGAAGSVLNFRYAPYQAGNDAAGAECFRPRTCARSLPSAAARRQAAALRSGSGARQPGGFRL